jgi:hypothetical protein
MTDGPKALDGAFSVLWPITDEWRVAALAWKMSRIEPDEKPARNLAEVDALVETFVNEHVRNQPPPTDFNANRRDATAVLQQLRLKAKRAKKRKARKR